MTPTSPSRRLILATAGFAACALLAFARPATPDDTELADLMGALKSNLKIVAQSLGAPETHGQALEALREMQVLSLAAKTAVPFSIAELEPAPREAQLVAYQVEMARLLGTLAEMEVDLLEGRTEAVAAAIAGKLFKLRDAAHDRWQ